MESTNDSNLFLDSVISQLSAGVSYLPGIITVILILVLGWVVARLVRRIVKKIGMASNRLLTRAFPSGIFSGARMSSLVVTILAETMFWATFLVAVTMAARFAEISSVSQWLDKITGHLPNLIAGIIIVVIGYFLSVFVREQLVPQTLVETLPTSPLPGRIAQGAVVTIALIIGLDQVGIDVALLIALTVVVASAILIAMGVAFAFAARTHLSNLIGVRTAHANLSPGMTIQIGDIEGEVVELAPTLVALDTDTGRVLVPGKLIEESVITVMSPVAVEGVEE